MARLTSNQRKAQASQASAKIEEEARKIAAETGCAHENALAQVFASPELLARCHAVAPCRSFPRDWIEPS